MADEGYRGRTAHRADSTSSSEAELHHTTASDPDDDLVNVRFGSHIRNMSPRRSSTDIEAIGRAARAELQRHAMALQESLTIILDQIEAVKQEHDKLDTNNKFLQKYIGDLIGITNMTTTSTTMNK